MDSSPPSNSSTSANSKEMVTSESQTTSPTPTTTMDPPQQHQQPQQPETWRDFTSEFRSFASSLGAGGMASAPSFNPARAITAMEFQSAKMDAGAAPVPKQPQDWTAEEVAAVVDALDRDPRLLGEFTDRLWFLENQHFCGASLAESVMTCPLAHPPILEALSKAGAKAQRVYALISSTLWACSSLATAVNLAGIFYEEDYAYATHNLTLPSLSSSEVVSLLDEALDSFASGIDDDEVGALKSRLRVRKFFVEAVVKLEAKEFPQAAEEIRLALALMDGLLALRPAPANATAAAPASPPTKENGATPTTTSNESASENNSTEDDSPLNQLFVPTLNYWRLVPNPPRRIPQAPKRAPQQAWEKLKSTLLGMKTVCTICDNVLKEELVTAVATPPPSPLDQKGGSTLTCLFDSLLDVVNAPSPMDTFARARLASALCDEQQRLFGVIPWSKVLLNDVEMFGPQALKAWELDEERQLQPLMQATLLSTMKTLCGNKARIRRMLVHRLEELGGQQQRCEAFDYQVEGLPPFAAVDVDNRQRIRNESLRPRDDIHLALGTWSSEWCLRLMAVHLELGADLSLYNPREATAVAFCMRYIYTLSHRYMYGSIQARGLLPKVGAVQELKNRLSDASNRRLIVAEIRNNLIRHMLMLLLTFSAELDALHPYPALVDQKVLFEHRFFDPFSTVWLPEPLQHADFARFCEANKAELVTKRVQVLEALSEQYKKLKLFCVEALKDPICANHAPTADFIKAAMRAAVVNGVGCASALGSANAKKPSKLQKVALDMPTRFGFSLMTVKIG